MCLNKSLVNMYGVKHEQFKISDKGFHAWVVAPEVRLANVIHLMVIPAAIYMNMYVYQSCTGQWHCVDSG